MKRSLIVLISISLLTVFLLFYSLYKQNLTIMVVQEQAKDRKLAEYQKNCEIHRDKINEDFMQYNLSQKSEIRDSDNTGDNPSLGLYKEYKELKEIFYSPVTKSCLYLESSKTIFKPGEHAEINDIDKWLVAYDTYYLTDITSGEQLKLKDDMPWAQRIVRGGEFHSEQEIQKSVNLYR